MSLLNNTKWVAVSQVCRILAQLISITVLTRYVTPSEYGLLAMATIVTNFALVIKDLGLSAAIIQKNKINKSFKDSVFTVNILIGLLLYLVVILASYPLSEYFEQPGISNILFLLGLIFPLSSLSSTHQALLERESKFKRVAIVEATSSIVGLGCALFMALKGFGVYSLVWQMISTQLISTLLFVFLGKDYKPKLGVNIYEIKSVINFGGDLTFFNIVNYFSRNADNLIVGAYYSSKILGGYNLAYRIMLFPLQSLTFIANRTLYPVMSRKQDSVDSIRNLYLSALTLVCSLTFPMMSGLAYLRVDFIELVFSEQWRGISDILLWLSLTGLLQSAVSTTGAVFMARGKTRLLLKLGVLGTALNVSSFYLGSNHSIEVFAKYYFLANAFNLIFPLYFVQKTLNGYMYELTQVFIPIVFSVSLMLLGMEAFSIIVTIENKLLLFLLKVTVGIFIYLIATLLVRKDYRTYLKDRVL